MSARFSHTLFVVLIFILLGPLLGAMLYALLMTLISVLENPDSSMNFIMTSLAFLPVAYFIGGAQALVVGIITAIRVWRHGSTPLWVPVLTAFIAAIIIQGRAFESSMQAFVSVSIHISAAALCWLVPRYALGWNKTIKNA